MRQANAVIRLNEEEARTLTDGSRRGTSEHRWVERAKIILLAHAGKTNQQIARQLHTRSAVSRNGGNGLESIGSPA